MEQFQDRPELAIYESAKFIVEADAHRALANIQKDQYSAVVNNPPIDTLVIDIDWKQKVNLPMGPSETSGGYYNRTQVAMMSVGFYWQGSKGRQNRVVDVISATVSETSHCSVAGLKEAFNLLRDQGADGLDILAFKNIDVWADAGSHFRSYEFLYFMLIGIPTIFPGVLCTINCLIGKHGKNLRDQHFRVIRGYLDRASRTTHIRTATDLNACLTKTHLTVQSRNRSQGKKINELTFTS